jgi:hypothetical protein
MTAQTQTSTQLSYTEDGVKALAVVSFDVFAQKKRPNDTAAHELLL